MTYAPTKDDTEAPANPSVGATSSILIVDDEDLIRLSLQRLLRQQGFTVSTAGTALEALQRFEAERPGIVILDIRLPDSNGLQLLKTLKETNPSVVVIMITANPDIQNSVEAMKSGAFDFLEKPIDLDRLRSIIGSIRREQVVTKKLPSGDLFVSSSPVMEEVYRITERLAAKDDVTFLVLGESGTGKSFLCRMLHELSSRRKKPFVEIGCSTIAEHLIESELFGHEKGAFTDAKTSKKGLVELADGGTVFLDEIGDMPYAMQSKLLMLIEDRKFRKVGGVQEVRVDVRIVAATHRNLHDLVQQGRFRLDLYYRLNVVTIELPPLRKRPDDIPLLAEHYLGWFATKHDCPVKSISPPAVEALKAYPWPGNVRELKNLMEKLVIMTKGERIGTADLPAELFTKRPVPGQMPLPPLPVEQVDGAQLLRRRATDRGAAPAADNGNGNGGRTNLSLRVLEEESIKKALREANGNQREAAKLLDITRDTLRYRMKKLGIRPE